MTVLDRDALDASPLADLHAIASELGLDGYRRLRRADLIDAIVGRGGGGADASDVSDAVDADAVDADADQTPAPKPRRRRTRAGGADLDADVERDDDERPAGERSRRGAVVEADAEAE